MRKSIKEYEKELNNLKLKRMRDLKRIKEVIKILNPMVEGK